MRIHGPLDLIFATLIALIVTIPVASATPLEPPPPNCDDFQVTSVNADLNTGYLSFKVVGTGLNHWLGNSYGVAHIVGQTSVQTTDYGYFNASPTAGLRTAILYIDFDPYVDGSFNVSVHLSYSSSGPDLCAQVIATPLPELAFASS